MKTPPFLRFATLLFWGWQSHWLVVGAIAGAVLEASRYLKFRWELEDVDFNRIWSFCVLVAVALAGYYITTSDQGGGLGRVLHTTTRNGSDTAPITAFRWLPLICFPFIAAQVFNVRPSVPLTAVSLVLRFRRRRGESSLAGRYLDISHAYFILCIFSAGIRPNNANHTFLWGQAILILWALWALRTRRFGFIYWLAAIIAIIALGVLGEFGIGQFERAVQNFNMRLMARLFRPNLDPTQAETRLGDIGELKLSSRVAVWLQPDKAGAAPNYLREASYQVYRGPSRTWIAGKEFLPVPVEPDNTSWVLLPNKPGAATVNITCYLNGRSPPPEPEPQGVLPLPSGTCRLLNLPALTSVAIKIETNKTGAVLATGSGLMVFDARYGPGETIDSGPDTATTNHFDINVPTNEVPALKQVISEMRITGTNDAQIRLEIAEFFASKFTYSTWQGPPPRGDTNTPLTRFLLSTRRGHCEYFATATVLLLRQLGVPARYAVGYSVHETSGTGYVVRERDAHAWCLAWDHDKNLWVDFDTTPASWVAIEGRNSALDDWLSDVRAWLGLQFEKLRWRQTHLRQYILWTLSPVIIVLAYFIIFQRRNKARAARKSATTEGSVVWPGHDSAFYRLEKAMARDLPREPDEPLSDWLERALSAPSLADFREPLRKLLRLHYRYRFDPQGLTDDEKKTLVEQVDLILQRLTVVAR